MRPEIIKILEDLYRIDPKLKGKESEVLAVVEKLLLAKPEIVADESFLDELRREVLAELSKVPKPAVGTGQLLAFVSRYRLSFAFGGVVLVLLFAVPFLKTGSPTMVEDTGLIAKSDVGNGVSQTVGKIEKIGRNGFGTLVNSSSGAVSERSDAAPRGLGGGGYTGVSMAVPAPSDAKMVAGTMPAFYRPTKPVFDFDGVVSAPPETVEVLKFNTSGGSVGGSMLSEAGMGLVDLLRLSDVRAQNVTLVEDREYGYQITANFDDGSVSIFQNWSRWPQPYSCNSRGECVEPPRITEADLPGDDVVIAASDDFLNGLGISLEGYGKPYLSNDWRYYQSTAEKAGEDYWIPDTLTVVYPMEVNGLPVFEQGGTRYGINVQYSIRNSRISGAGLILGLNFLGSDYDAETDVAKVSEAIRNGNSNWGYYQEDSIEVHYALGEPIDCYMLTYTYSEYGQSSRLLVPARAFRVDRENPTVVSGGEDGAVPDRYYSEFIVIPLARDFYQDLSQNPNGPILMRSGIEPAVMETPSDKPLR